MKNKRNYNGFGHRISKPSISFFIKLTNVFRLELKLCSMLDLYYKQYKILSNNIIRVDLCYMPHKSWIEFRIFGYGLEIDYYPDRDVNDTRLFIRPFRSCY